MKSKTLLFFCFLLPLISICQRITYSDQEKEDARSVDFEIIGKVSDHFLVYKNIRNRYVISVYNSDMTLNEKVSLDFMPDKTLNAEFVSYPNFCYLIYQYQKKNILYCMAAKIDGNGKKLGDPIVLDTTRISIFADNKIYSMVNSEDKQKIMIYKIQKKNDIFNFTTLLFNWQLQLQHTSKLRAPYDEKKDVYSDFLVDNDGTFVFSKSLKNSNRDLISRLFLVTKESASDKFVENELSLNKSYLDEVTIKIDNFNKRYLLNSFYYNQKRGNIDGLFTALWDKQTNKPLLQNMLEFNDSIKAQAKIDGPLRFAFNDYFIRNIILKKDGGFILSAESFTSQTRSNQFNRMDYLYNSPYVSSYDYYLLSRSPYWYYSGRNSSFNSQIRYYYNNIVILNVESNGKLAWTNIIHKQQFDDGDANFLSYQVMNAGGELHFLFNELERRTQLITDQSINVDGKITRNPTLKSLDKGYEFMPKFAKQVSAKQIIVPCIYRNYICFAKIDY